MQAIQPSPPVGFCDTTRCQEIPDRQRAEFPRYSVSQYETGSVPALNIRWPVSTLRSRAIDLWIQKDPVYVSDMVSRVLNEFLDKNLGTETKHGY